MSNAKAAILERIWRVNGDPSPTREQDYSLIERRFRRGRVSEPEHVIDTFIDRLVDYGSEVHRCAEADIAHTVYQVVKERQKHSLLVSLNVPLAWRPADFHFVEDSGLSHDDLDESEGVLTGCLAAIALTGTIILEHKVERRALTLIPDYHLCVVFENQVSETVPEAIARIEPFNKTPLTTISGSSATADIEMTRIKGVHGPRVLDVILVNC